MSKHIWVGVIMAFALASAQANAADLGGGYGPQCVSYKSSQLIDATPEEIKNAVNAHFMDAKLAMSEPRIVATRTPVFTWANEARLACGKAAGYLQGGYLDEDSIQSCDCFYQRFVSFR